MLSVDRIFLVDDDLLKSGNLEVLKFTNSEGFHLHEIPLVREL
jgi:hypothetical protein